MIRQWLNDVKNDTRTKLPIEMSSLTYYVGFNLYDTTRADSNYYSYVSSRENGYIKINNINLSFDTNAKCMVLVIGY